MKKKKLTKSQKGKLGVLWVLLNISTEIDYDSLRIFKLMRAITKTYPNASKMWDKNFEIKVEGKTIFTWINTKKDN